MAAHLDSSWSGKKLQAPELMFAVGVAAAFVGVVTNIILLALESGRRQGGGQHLHFFGLDSHGAASGRPNRSEHFCVVSGYAEKWHSNLLGQYVDPGNWLNGRKAECVGLHLNAIISGSERCAGALGWLARRSGKSPGIHSGVLRCVHADRVGDRWLPGPALVPTPEHSQSSSGWKSDMNINRYIALITCTGLMSICWQALAAGEHRLTLADAAPIGAQPE